MSSTPHSHVPAQPFILKQPVGLGMPNTAEDVKAVQAALARWWTFLGKHRLPSVAQPPAKLQQEIKDFQAEVMRQATPSGVVAPGDATALKLAERPAPNKLDVMPVRPPVGQLSLNAAPGTPLTLPPRTGVDALSEDDYAGAAKTLGCESLVIQALALQEGRDRGFDSYNRPTILYEPNHFAKLSKPLTRDYKALYPTLTHLHKPPHAYGSDTTQWEHLQQAYLLNPHDALLSVSWGKLQVLGAYYLMAGFSSVELFVTAMCASEQQQLGAFVSYIQSKKLGSALKAKDWQAIGAGYNGALPSNGNYASSLKRHYDDLSN